MLNCTDELCHLHHHHHHESDHFHHHDVDPQHQHQVMSSGETAAAENYDINDTSLESNGTEPDELPSSSHVDAPSEGLYTACGVLIAMLLVALIILLLAVTISKLRKREESSGSVVQHANGGATAQQTTHNCNSLQHGCVQHAAVLQQTELTVISASQQEPPPFLWVYSTSNNSLDCQVHHSQDLLVRPDSCDAIDGECKNGLRKNLRVKWNRLVKKKTQHEIYSIPAELRPQLKQIYVY